MADDVKDPQTDEQTKPAEDGADKPEEDDLDNKIEKAIKADTEVSEREIKKNYNTWKRNVELRLGTVSTLYTGGVSVPESDIKTEINPDWYLTKTKSANLFSQVPTVRMTHRNKKVMLAISPFEKSLNYELGSTRAKAKVAMKECLSDIINAAGIGAALVEWNARFEETEVPAVAIPPNIPPEAIKKAMAMKLIPTKTQPVPVDTRFSITRKSPTDLLYASNFVGSDFDDADWVGEKGLMPWSIAVGLWDLDEKDKDALTKATGTDGKKETDLRTQSDKSGTMAAPSVSYKRLWYWRYRFDAECKSFSEIWEIVFLEGKTEAVKHEAYKGQKYDEQSKKMVGVCRFPLRFGALTYISDNPLPPSDSEAARPQVNDLRRSRSQAMQNRERSFPFRWFNTNLVDMTMWDNLMKGTVQGAIPVNGTGDRAFGEVARASWPSEDGYFDQLTMADLDRMWGMGPQAQGSLSPGKRTKGEVDNAQQNFATVIGQDRDAIAEFFLGIADVLAGLMVMYSDWPILDEQEKAQMFEGWGGKHVLHDVVYKIRPDSTIVLDVAQRLQRLERFVNFTGKSGMTNLLPVLFEYAELSGIDDVTDVVHPPLPKPPEEPSISLRLSNKQDLMNVGVMAMLHKHKKAPGPEDIVAAEDTLAAIQNPQLAREKIAQAQAQAAQAGQGAPGAHPPAPGAPHPGQVPQGGTGANKDWTMNDRVVKRTRDAQ